MHSPQLLYVLHNLTAELGDQGEVIIQSIEPLSFPGSALLLFFPFFLFLPDSVKSPSPWVIQGKPKLHCGPCFGIIHLLSNFLQTQCFPWKEQRNSKSVMCLSSQGGRLTLHFLPPNCCHRQRQISLVSAGASTEDGPQWCRVLGGEAKDLTPPQTCLAFHLGPGASQSLRKSQILLGGWSYLLHVERILKAHSTIQVSVVIIPMMFI